MPSDSITMLPHMHKDTDELIFIINGSGKCYIDKHTIDVKEGTICVLRFQTVHRLAVSTGAMLEYCSIQLNPQYINDNFLIGNYKYNILSDEDLIPMMRKAFNTLISLKKGDSSPSLSKSEWLYCNTLIALALENFENTEQKIKPDQTPVIFEVWKYIKQHYNEKISLSTLSQKFLMSISSLNRQFYAEYNISPIEFVIENRIYNASLMLSDTDMSIKEIADEVGYSNVSYFTSLFTKRRGCAPSEYRQKKDSISTIRITSVELNPSIPFENI